MKRIVGLALCVLATAVSAQTSIDLSLTAQVTTTIPTTPNGYGIKLNCKSAGVNLLSPQLKIFKSLNGGAETQTSPDSLKMTCTGTGQDFPFGDTLSPSDTSAKYRFAVTAATGETNLTNNEVIVEFLPDLVPSFTSTTVAFQKVNSTTMRLTVSTRIKNAGTISSALCANQVLYDGAGVATFNTNLIAPGQQQDQSVSFDLPNAKFTGKHTITLKADMNNTVKESNATNNQTTIPFVGGIIAGSGAASNLHQP
jgi:hypothetical protein